jgi:hypothetical protein
MSNCWCIEYHFTGLAGAEVVCEHDCHWGTLDPAGAAYWQREAERLMLEQEIEMRAVLQMLASKPAEVVTGPTRRGKAWLLDRLRRRR